MKLYKLTDEHDRTYGGCQWGENVTHKTSGEGGLCGPGFTHWYTHPLLAVWLNPIHAGFNLETAHLWEGEGEVVKTDRSLKVGCTRATTIKRVPLPRMTPNQLARAAILTAKQIYHEEEWNKWADRWLSGEDRSAEAAHAADSAAYVSAAYVSAAHAARSAAHAARSATHAYVSAAHAAYFADSAARASASRLAAHVGIHAAYADDSIDLAAIAERAIREEPT